MLTPRSVPKGKTFEFDVVGHPRANFHFTCIFPIRFSSGTPQVTILREYCWGPDSILHSLPTGGFDPKKHTSYEECAKDELSEEAHLHGGELVRLLPNGHAGIAESKWCANRFTPFLCIDPEVSRLQSCLCIWRDPNRIPGRHHHLLVLSAQAVYRTTPITAIWAAAASPLFMPPICSADVHPLFF